MNSWAWSRIAFRAHEQVEGTLPRQVVLAQPRVKDVILIRILSIAIYTHKLVKQGRVAAHGDFLKCLTATGWPAV